MPPFDFFIFQERRHPAYGGGSQPSLTAWVPTQIYFKVIVYPRHLPSPQPTRGIEPRTYSPPSFQPMVGTSADKLTMPARQSQSRWSGLNRWPTPYHGVALPAELQRLRLWRRRGVALPAELSGLGLRQVPTQLTICFIIRNCFSRQTINFFLDFRQFGVLRISLP